MSMPPWSRPSVLLVGNGGRHDDWLAPLMRAAEHRPVALLAEQLRTPASAGSGEDHYWYGLLRVAALVGGVVARLTRISPQQAETFATNAGVLREAMLAAALDARIPIVDVPEVMPDDTETYPLWLGYQIDALAGALADTS